MEKYFVWKKMMEKFVYLNLEKPGKTSFYLILQIFYFCTFSQTQ